MEIKVKAWKTSLGNIMIPYESIPLQLLKNVDFAEVFDLTLSIPPDPRGDWIEKWYKKATENRNVAFYYHKTATICVASYGVTISDVCKGDTYDRKTGIAVAYAKLQGESIPDFI